MSTAPVTLLNANPGAVAASYTTASVTPAANTRAVVFGTYDKASLLASKPTIADDHIAAGYADPAWVELGNVHTSTASNPDLWIVAWCSRDMGATPPTMLVTVAATGGRAGTCSIDTVLSADTNGTALQVASGEDLATGDPSFTFANPPGANNIVIGCNWHGGGNAITKPTGYTSLYDNTPTNVASRRHEVFYDNTSAAQGPNQSISLNARSIVLAIELAPASTGSVGTASGTGAAAGVAASDSTTIGSSAGTGAATGVSASTSAVVGTASGTGAASGVAAASSAVVGSAAGTSSADGVGDPGSGGSTGTASGTGTATGVGDSDSGFRVTSTGTGYAHKTLTQLRKEEQEELARVQRQARKAVAAVISAPGILSGDLTAIVRREVPQSWLTPELITLIVTRIEAQFRRAFIRKQQEDDEDDEDAILLVA